MNNKWTVIYYETTDKRCPIEEFIDSRDKKNQAKILAMISYLEEMGPNLPRPYSGLLDDGIHELRIKLSGEQIRTLYFFCYKEFIVLTNSFIKNSSVVPDAQIKKSKAARIDFLKRYSEKELKVLVNENIQKSYRK
jgi:hypothetical protein